MPEGISSATAPATHLGSLADDLDKLNQDILRLSGKPGSPLARCIGFLLDSQNPDGSWGSQEFPVWRQVVTAHVVHAFLRLGYTRETIWETPHGSKGGLGKSIDWLLTQQKEDGSFGEDLWDTCFVLRTLLCANVESSDPTVRKGIDFVDKELSSDLPNRGSEWFGPGFVAQACLLYQDLGRKKEAERAADALIALRSVNGAYAGPTGRYTVWHSSQAVMALLEVGRDPMTDPLKETVNWLERQQNPDGSWDIEHIRVGAIIACHAALAIGRIRGYISPQVEATRSWLISHQTPNSGMVVDIPCTAMVAFLISESDPGDLAVSVPLVTLARIADRIRKAGDRATEEDARQSTLEARASSLKDSSAFRRMAGPTVVGLTAVLGGFYGWKLLPDLEAYLKLMGLDSQATAIVTLLLVPILLYYPASYGVFLATGQPRKFWLALKIVTSFLVIGIVLSLVVTLLP